MSATSAIAVSDLGKRYRLGQLEGGYQLLSERLGERVRRFGRVAPRPSTEEFWALRGVEFQVERGETFGIIGHNGAGKSTLLKVLSRVTPPTTGEIRVRGRVGALLEVGTGFHPELTGRENIFLNGAILGMSRGEIAARFDEIVEFAGVARFIDTPVKRYSSGMYLRLAFAVAAHLEPEILIVDEVLSVGDLAFQEKCLGRMEAVAGEGRTVMFVSHNLAAVSNLCPRSMLLENGRKVAEGPTRDVITRYVKTAQAAGESDLATRRDRRGSGALRYRSLHLEDSHGSRVDAPQSGQDVDFVLRYEMRGDERVPHVNAAVQVSNLLGVTMLHLYSRTSGDRLEGLPRRGELRCRLPRLPLPAGQYHVTLWADVGGEILDWIQQAARLTVAEGDFFGSGQPPLESHQTVLVDYEWTVAEVPVEAR